MPFLTGRSNTPSSGRRDRLRAVRRRPGRNPWWIFHPGCEPMEARTLLSTVNWVGSGTGGSWDVAANWLDATTMTNHVPTAADNAVINLTSAGTVTLNSNAADAANSLTTNANTSISIGNGDNDALALTTTSTIGGGLTETNGKLSGAATLTVDGAIVWTGGTISGSGTLNAEGGITLGGTTMGNYDEVLAGWTLNNYGTATLSVYFTNDSQGLYLSYGGTLDNEAGASFSITTDADIAAYGGSPNGGTVNNQGTFAKTGGTGTSTVGLDAYSGTVPFNQSGSGVVEAESGTLSLIGGGTSSGTSTISAASGATLAWPSNSASYTLDAGTTISGTGIVAINGGTIDVAGAVTCTGLIDFSSGIITGTGTLTIDSTMNWTDGAMTKSDGSGTADVASSGTLNMGGTTSDTDYTEGLYGWTLNNYGTATLSTYYNTEGLYFYNGGTLDNEAGASFSFATDSNIVAYGGSPPGGTVNNQGTFAKTGGTCTSTVSYDAFNSDVVAFNQSGSGIVEAESGTLSLIGGGTFSGSSSSLAAASGATLALGGGSFSVNAVDASGAGTIAVVGSPVSVTVSGDLDSTAALFVVRNGNGTLAIDGASTIATLSMSGGTLSCNSTLTVATLSMSGGTLSGTSTLTVSGTTTWTGGTMSGTGATDADGGLTLGGTTSGTGYEETLDGWTLNNYGTATLSCYTTGQGLYLADAGVLDNEAGASFSITTDAYIQSTGYSSPAGTVDNQGTFAKTGGSTTSLVGYNNGDGTVTFSNSGTLEALSGTLYLDGPFSNFSGTTLTGGSYIVATTLEFNNAAIHTDAASITLQGSSAEIINQSGTNALTGLASITSAGSFASLGGPTVSVTGSLDNAGIIQAPRNGNRRPAQAGKTTGRGDRRQAGEGVSTTLVNDLGRGTLERDTGGVGVDRRVVELERRRNNVGTAGKRGAREVAEGAVEIKRPAEGFERTGVAERHGAVTIVVTDEARRGAPGLGKGPLVVHSAGGGRVAGRLDVGVGGDAERRARLIVKNTRVCQIQALAGRVAGEGRRPVVVECPAIKSLLVARAAGRPAEGESAVGVGGAGSGHRAAGPGRCSADGERGRTAQSAAGHAQGRDGERGITTQSAAGHAQGRNRGGPVNGERAVAVAHDEEGCRAIEVAANGDADGAADDGDGPGTAGVDRVHREASTAQCERGPGSGGQTGGASGECSAADEAECARLCLDDPTAALVERHDVAVKGVIADGARACTPGLGEGPLIVHRATRGRSSVGHDVGVGGEAERCAGLVVESASVVEIQALGVVVGGEGRRAVVVQCPAVETLGVVRVARRPAHVQSARAGDVGGAAAVALGHGTVGPIHGAVDGQRTGARDDSGAEVDQSCAGNGTGDVDCPAVDRDDARSADRRAGVERVGCAIARPCQCRARSRGDRRGS